MRVEGLEFRREGACKLLKFFGSTVVPSMIFRFRGVGVLVRSIAAGQLQKGVKAMLDCRL